MNKEIELKARISSPESLRKRLEEFYGAPLMINKDDVYYQYEGDFNEEGRMNVRLRREAGKNVVTLKQKFMNNGIEINDELEFSVDNAENFLQFLKLTGAKSWIVKSKKGWRFTDGGSEPPAVIELCEVGNLGWFIEIEVVLDSDDAAAVKEAEGRIKRLLKMFDVEASAIESKFYSEMIIEQSV